MPEEIVRAILDADAVGAAHDVAVLAHADYCADIKRRQLFSLTAQSGANPQLGRRGLGAPTEKEAKALLQRTLEAIFGVHSLEELEAIDPRGVVERILAAQYWALPPQSGRGEIVGIVSGDAEETHVVIEQRWPLPPGTEKPRLLQPKVSVMTVRLANGEWRSLLNGGLVIQAQHPIPFGAGAGGLYHWTPGATYRKGSSGP